MVAVADAKNFVSSASPTLKYTLVLEMLPHLPINWTYSTSLDAWGSAVAPPRRKLCDLKSSSGRRSI